MEREIEVKIAEWLSEARRLVLMGLGNPFRKDDRFGIEVIRKLSGKISQGILLIEVETIPESYIEQIIDFNPSHILMIDAAMINSKPGVIKFLTSKALTGKVSTSTHSLPLSIFCDYLERNFGIGIALILVQPKETDFGEEISSEVEGTINELVLTITKILS